MNCSLCCFVNPVVSVITIEAVLATFDPYVNSVLGYISGVYSQSSRKRYDMVTSWLRSRNVVKRIHDRLATLQYRSDRLATL